ncbi:hypothetical protein [Cohnella thermotolerans]|uniref:hypothetical protein n=1 Tax=Cohnella thermotolerans TaxID=329858 RepID=UPI00040A79AF|nr:hypothetical protein [Cohnella thermotolerans]
MNLQMAKQKRGEKFIKIVGGAPRDSVCERFGSGRRSVYEAFSIGFSDYMVAMDISREAFAKRFFGPEGMI